MVMGEIAAKLTSVVDATRIKDWDALSEDWQQQVALACPSSTQTQPVTVFPQTEAELSAVVALAYAEQWTMLPCGSGSKLGWGGLMPTVDLVVSTVQLNQVVAHWIDDFTVRVQAGVRLADLQAVLRSHNQCLPIDPLYDTQATLGGIVATADTGSLRQRYGGIRDLLIGVQMVRDDGQVAKAGGRVVKNVAGYDLMKLMTGAYGTLAVLSELTLKLYPLPEQVQSVRVTGTLAAIAETALQVRLAGITPVAMDWLGGPAFGLSTDEVILAGRFEGLAEGVEEQVARLKAIAQTAGTEVALEDDALFPSVRQALADRPILCKLGLQPTAIAPLFDQAQQSLSGWGLRVHNAGGLGLMACESGEWIALRSVCQSAGGFLTLLAAPVGEKTNVDIWGYSGNALNTMQQLKANFDPRALLSPGRFVGGI